MNIQEWMNEWIILVSTGIKLPQETATTAIILKSASASLKVSYPWKSGRPDTSYKKSFRKL